MVDLVTEGPSPVFWPQSGIQGNNPLCSIYFDGVPLLNGDGSPNYNLSGQGFNFGFNSGRSGQLPITGFDKVEALIPLPYNTRVTNPPPNAAFPNVNAGYPKSVIAVFNTTMYPDAEGVKVTVRFPAVYTIDPDTNNTNGFNITWAVDISLNNGPFTQVDLRNLTDITPSPKCTTPYLNTKIYTLPKTTPAQTFYEWRVRVRRVSLNVLASTTQNDMYVDSMAVVSSNQYSYPMSAMAGIEISADQFAGIPTRAYDVKGIEVLVPDGYIPTQYNQSGGATFTRRCDIDINNTNIGMTTQVASELNGIVIGTTVSGPGIPAGTTVTYANTVGPDYYFAVNQNPTATNYNVDVTFPTPYIGGAIYPAVYPTIWTGGLNSRKWTDNPAWIFYDIVTNKRYGLGRYIRPEWLDKWTLYQIAQFCDEMVDDGEGGLEPRFTCNVAIQEPQDAYTLLNNLVSVFRGMLYWANGRIFPVGSQERDPVFNFSNSNVVNGVFSYSDTPRNTRSTVCVIKWVDPTNLFRTTPERVEDTAGIARFGYVEKQITAFATTSRGQAIRAANWILTVEQLLTETISFQTDTEGLYLRPGDVFNVYDNFRNNQSQGGRIVDFGTGNILLDKPVAIQNGFTYVVSALVPATNISNGDDITGSNQIGLIRNSQIETRVVTTAPTASTTNLTINSGFSSALYKGSVWILNASGNSVTVFDQATPYKCLSIGEPSPGVFEILGLKSNTGVNYLVNNNYSAVVSPPISGDTTPPAPPTGISITLTTGLQIDNQFFSYVYMAWNPSTSANTAYYTVSGQVGAQPFLIGQPITTGINFTPTVSGDYVFSVAAVNANGYQSAFARTGYNVPASNPLGVTAPLSGLYIAANADPYYIRSSDARYTGYVGTSPSFGWHITLDENGNEIPTAQFITGYRVRLLELGNESNVLSLSDISLSGADNTIWNLDPRYLYTGTTVTPLRGFTVSVDTVDEFNNVRSGARLAVNNPQLPPPLNSGFIGYNGGITYNVTPRPQADTSGIMLWVNQNPAFSPTSSNVQFISTNLAGTASIAPQTGSFYTWFALTDTYGFGGALHTSNDYTAPIYGPISGNAEGLFGTFFTDITAQLTGALGLLTGTFTNFQTQLTNSGTQTLLMVNGLSGSITGSGTAINQALSVQTQQTVTSASGALATQINAVSARLVTTGATNYALAGVVMDALATTGGANSAYLTQLAATTTGNNATVKIAASATVTGQLPNGLGGAAIARWGFELDANGKVVSMQATSASWTGNGGYGTIVFGNAILQSSNYVAGSAGWRLTPGGNFEGNAGAFRGQVFVNSGTANQVIIGQTNAGSQGITVGGGAAGNGERATINATTDVVTPRTLSFSNAGNSLTAFIGNKDLLNGGGQLGIQNGGGGQSIYMDGQNGFLYTTGTASGRALLGNSYFEVGINSAVDVKGVNFRVYDSLGNQANRIDNTNGTFYISGNNVVKARWPGAVPTTTADVIAILQYHGLSP